MSDDMGEKFKQIADLLGQSSNTNIPDNVKGIFNMLMSSSNSKDEDDKSTDTVEEHSENTRPKDNTGNDSSTDNYEDIARKMKKAIGMINPDNDPRSNLLNAIKPYLSKNRQKKLQTCMKLMKIGSLTRILDESE